MKKRTLEADDIAAMTTVYATDAPPLTCAPPMTYDLRGGGDPSRFRNQCGQAVSSGGCAGAPAHDGSPATGGIVLLGLVLVGLSAGCRLREQS